MKQVPGWPDPPKAPLQEPNGSGYLLLAATIERFSRFARPTPARRAALEQAALRAQQIGALSGVRSTCSFRAVVAPPGGRAGEAAPRYDVVVLVETVSPEVAVAIAEAAPVTALQDDWRRSGGKALGFAAANVRRIAELPDDKDAVYLFNFFTGPDEATVLDTWQHTAGWFVEETGLKNSTLLQPRPETPAPFAAVNHASWPAFATFLPGLLFKPSFRRFVLEAFRLNGVVPTPILYRRDRRVAGSAG